MPQCAFLLFFSFIRRPLTTCKKIKIEKRRAVCNNSVEQKLCWGVEMDSCQVGFYYFEGTCFVYSWLSHQMEEFGPWRWCCHFICIDLPPCLFFLYYVCYCCVIGFCVSLCVLLCLFLCVVCVVCVVCVCHCVLCCVCVCVCVTVCCVVCDNNNNNLIPQLILTSCVIS